MTRLSPDLLLHIWEVGARQHAIDRALTILAAALPDAEYAALCTMSIGQRDALLLSVHEETFGPYLSSVLPCPQCQEQTELTVVAGDLRVAPPTPPTAAVHHLVMDGYALDFRLPHSHDLAAIATCADVAHARATLVQLCLMRVVWQNETMAVEALPDRIGAALAEAMSALDPQADIALELTCPACGYRWALVFDIVAYLWLEISAAAKRLLREVHVLASAYGWGEQDILTMSTLRRQFYLDMVT